MLHRHRQTDLRGRHRYRWQHRDLHNDANGHAAFLARLAGVKVELIVMEATGALERELACLLQASGFAVAVVNPRQARNFAKAMGHLAKTDRIDARALAELAQTLARHPQRARFVRPLPTPEQQLLQGMVARRRQLVSSLVTERQRLLGTHPDLRKNVEALIASIQARLDEVEAAMTHTSQPIMPSSPRCSPACAALARQPSQR